MPPPDLVASIVHPSENTERKIVRMSNKFCLKNPFYAVSIQYKLDMTYWTPCIVANSLSILMQHYLKIMQKTRKKCIIFFIKFIQLFFRNE